MRDLLLASLRSLHLLGSNFSAIQGAPEYAHAGVILGSCCWVCFRAFASHDAYLIRGFQSLSVVIRPSADGMFHL